jgi:hypothetical protein
MAGDIPAIYEFTYAIVWWGLLILMDEWNAARLGVSLWRNAAPRFFWMTLPLSALYWISYEVLNLYMPQWRYTGGIRSLHAQVLFGLVSFATVIPIIIECYWVAAEVSGVPAAIVSFAARNRVIFVVLGAISLSLPLYSPFFWINQAMWLGPGLILLPVRSPGAHATKARFWRGVVLGSLLSGLLWESINYWANTRWQYIIEMNQPHLFEMPVFGYFGFIPFGFSIVIFYDWYSRLPVRAIVGLALYAAAIVALYVMTSIYVRNGLWVTTSRGTSTKPTVSTETNCPRLHSDQVHAEWSGALNTHSGWGFIGGSPPGVPSRVQKV